MKKILQNVYSIFLSVGIDPLRTIKTFRGMPGYFRDLRTLKNQMDSSAQRFSFGKHYLCLDDKFTESGSVKGHYFHQDLLISRRIYYNNPSLHVDIGSRIDGFVAHVASFRHIEVIDIRPLSRTIPNIKFIQTDIMKTIPNHLSGHCDSLSCLHALEHFGLGRYGDPVICDGHIVGLNNIYSILKQGGKLYLSTPIGPQRIEFNAHRVFSVSYLLENLKNKYTLDCFSYIDDQGDLHEDVQMTDSGIINNFGCVYGCGIFELTKL